jgi:hypothetical protein
MRLHLPSHLTCWAINLCISRLVHSYHAHVSLDQAVDHRQPVHKTITFGGSSRCHHDYVLIYYVGCRLQVDARISQAGTFRAFFAARRP